MSKYKLTARELDVMHVLWNSEDALAVTDIPKLNPKLKLNTVQGAIKNLTKKSYIKVDNIVYHNTVLTRTFTPVLTQEEYMIDYFDSGFINRGTLFSALIKSEFNPKTLKKLENILHEQQELARKEEDDK